MENLPMHLWTCPRIRLFFYSSTLLSVIFKDVKKFDVQNPIIGNIISQVNANQIGEKGVKELFAKAEDEKIRRRLKVLQRQDNEDGDGGGGWRGDPDNNNQPPPRSLPLQRLPSPPTFLPPQSPPSLDDLFDEEGGFFETESLNEIRNDLWNEAEFETDYKKL